MLDHGNKSFNLCTVSNNLLIYAVYQTTCSAVANGRIQYWRCFKTSEICRMEIDSVMLIKNW